MWQPLVGAVCHVYGGRADMAPWTESVGPRWTSYLTPKGYLILTVHLDLKVLVTLDDLWRLHGISGEPAITGGEAARRRTLVRRLHPPQTKPNAST